MTLAYCPTPQAAPAIADVMRGIGVQMTFAKGEEIFGQDEDADLIYSIIKGAVRTIRILVDGRRQVGDFHYRGDLLGLEIGDSHRFTAEALTDCTILVVRRSSLRSFSGDGVLDRAIWEATRRELERTQEHVLVLSRKSACERVASFLLEFADREDADQVELPMGRQDMADYLGLTIETVSRMVSQLQGSRIVQFDTTRRYRVTRPEALERLVA